MEEPEVYDKTFFGKFRGNMQIPYYRAGILALLGADLTSAPAEWKEQCFQLAERSALEIKDLNWKVQSLVGIAELLIDVKDIQGARRVLSAVALFGVAYAEVKILAKLGIATGEFVYITSAQIAAKRIDDPLFKKEALQGIEDATKIMNLLL